MHYLKILHQEISEDISSGNITEKFGLKKEHVMNASTRKRDDFCPRKQLEETTVSCGQPEFELNDNNTGEGESVCTVVDRNKTLQKMLAKVDEFVEKFTGEDLKSVAVKEIKRRYGAKVKTHVGKSTNASARAMEKAKTYDDFDWEKLVRNNELGNLYVSQIDLYLVENLNMSKKDCDKKGFTKALKIEEIKKHFYSSRHDDDATGRKRTSQQKIHVALSSSSTNTKDASTVVKVPPWGGTILVPHHGHVNLVNTCPIDNFLCLNEETR